MRADLGREPRRARGLGRPRRGRRRHDTGPVRRAPSSQSASPASSARVQPGVVRDGCSVGRCPGRTADAQHRGARGRAGAARRRPARSSGRCRAARPPAARRCAAGRRRAARPRRRPGRSGRRARPRRRRGRRPGAGAARQPGRRAVRRCAAAAGSRRPAPSARASSGAGSASWHSSGRPRRPAPGPAVGGSGRLGPDPGHGVVGAVGQGQDQALPGDAASRPPGTARSAVSDAGQSDRGAVADQPEQLGRAARRVGVVQERADRLHAVDQQQDRAAPVGGPAPPGGRRPPGRAGRPAGRSAARPRRRWRCRCAAGRGRRGQRARRRTRGRGRAARRGRAGAPPRRARCAAAVVRPLRGPPTASHAPPSARSSSSGSCAWRSGRSTSPSGSRVAVAADPGAAASASSSPRGAGRAAAAATAGAAARHAGRAGVRGEPRGTAGRGRCRRRRGRSARGGRPPAARSTGGPRGRLGAGGRRRRRPAPPAARRGVAAAGPEVGPAGPVDGEVGGLAACPGRRGSRPRRWCAGRSAGCSWPGSPARRRRRAAAWPARGARPSDRPRWAMATRPGTKAGSSSARRGELVDDDDQPGQLRPRPGGRRCPRPVGGQDRLAPGQLRASATAGRARSSDRRGR